MSTMLRDLLDENVENRVTLTRVNSILEDLAQHLSSKEQEKLADIYVELQTLATALNHTPYTAFNNEHWSLLKMILAGKVATMILAVDDIAESNKKVNCAPLKLALQGILTY